jgi:hypothetical protein
MLLKESSLTGGVHHCCFVLLSRCFSNIVAIFGYPMKNPFPTGHIFADFVVSDALDSIYYADLFEINGRNWMIQGFGKTEAARIASNKEKTAILAMDSVAIIRQGDSLFGRADFGAGNYDANSDLYRMHKIDVIAYCLDETQTHKAFQLRGGVLEIVEVDHHILSALCATYPYPAALAAQFASAQELELLSNPARMMQRFLELTDGAVGSKFLLVPYMPNIDDKAALYRSYSF